MGDFCIAVVRYHVLNLFQLALSDLLRSANVGGLKPIMLYGSSLTPFVRSNYMS